VAAYHEVGVDAAHQLAHALVRRLGCEHIGVVGGHGVAEQDSFDLHRRLERGEEVAP